jgi:hypothetical protein
MKVPIKLDHLSALLPVLISVYFISCNLDSVFKTKYEDCRGDFQTEKVRWYNPDSQPEKGSTLVGHTAQTDEKYIFRLDLGAYSACVGEPMNFSSTVYCSFDLEGTGLTEFDIEVYGYYKVQPSYGNDDQVLNEGLLTFASIIVDSYNCKKTIGLATNAEDVIFVDVFFTVEIALPKDKLENTSYGEYYFLDIIELIIMDADFTN